MKRMTDTVGVQFDNYTTCDSALEFCGSHSVNQMLDQWLTRPEKGPEGDKEVALKGLEAARKYTCQFDTKNNITVMCNKVENELYKPRAQGKKKHET
jgi:hypothetical protein